MKLWPRMSVLFDGHDDGKGYVVRSSRYLYWMFAMVNYISTFNGYAQSLTT